MKKLIIYTLLFTMLASLACAATVVNLDPTSVLENATVSSSQTIQHGFNVTGNQSTWTCLLYSTENGSNGAGTYRAITTDSGVANNSNTLFSSRGNVAETVGVTNIWNVFCSGATDTTGAWGTVSNYTYGVDVTDPDVTINEPSNGDWYTSDTGVLINLTVVDNNVNTCVLGSNLNVSTNNSGNYVSTYETYSYTNNTAFAFTLINSSNAWEDNNTGTYLWTYTCTDDAGNEASLGSNYTFFVDTVLPTAFVFNTSLWETTNSIPILNASTCTDYTPTVGWDITTELNFSKYEITFFDTGYGVYNSSTDIRKDVTTIASTSTAIDSLAADTTYVILITAYDLAGNQRNMTVIPYAYTSDSTSRNLYDGWNIIMNTGNAMNLSTFLTDSSATYVSYFNSSHAFETHISGGSYGGRNIPYGDSVFLYMDGTTGQMEDLVVNTSAGGTKYNITNATASDWNVACNRNATGTATFQELDLYCNGGTYLAVASLNVTYLDYFNASASTGNKFIPYIANWSEENNETALSYGDCAFMEVGIPEAFIEIDWSVI